MILWIVFGTALVLFASGIILCWIIQHNRDLEDKINDNKVLGIEHLPDLKPDEKIPPHIPPPQTRLAEIRAEWHKKYPLKK